MIISDDIGGVHVKYFYHCRRQLWLYGRGYRPERHDELVQLGEAINDTSYQRRSPVDLGAARLDFIDGHHLVHEVKSSSRMTEADKAQVLRYCLRLRQVGVDAQGGVLHYPKTRRTCRIAFGEAEAAQARADINDALEVLAAPESPPRLSRSRCRGCSFTDYCWASG